LGVLISGIDLATFINHYLIKLLLQDIPHEDKFLSCLGSKIFDLDHSKTFRHSEVENKGCKNLRSIIFASSKPNILFTTLVLQERYDVEVSADFVMLIITLAQTMLAAGATVGSVSAHLWLRFMRFAICCFFSIKKEKVNINTL